MRATRMDSEAHGRKLRVVTIHLLIPAALLLALWRPPLAFAAGRPEDPRKVKKVPQAGRPDPDRRSPNLDLAAACQGNRWIGVLNERGSGPGGRQQAGNLEAGQARRAHRCPRSWKPLFESDGQVPPGLERFCLYQGPDPRKKLAVIDPQGRIYFDPQKSPDRPSFEPVPWKPGKGAPRDFFERIDRDCRVVGPAAATLFPPEPLSRALKGRFLREVGEAPAGIGSGDVRLQIIDSVEDSDEPESKACPSQSKAGELECSPHGWVLANLARDILRDTVRVGSRQALRRTYRTGSSEEVRLGGGGLPQTGGLYGYWSELGSAIWRALDAARAEGTARRLILNLSVGWESIYGEDVAVVRAPLEAAVCSGALVVAAAGNRRSGPPSLEQPLLPAAWEQVDAPSVERCRALLGEEPTGYASRSDYRPLLFAAGGVQRYGRRLSIAKPRATPRLVAFGDHASVWMPADGPGVPGRLVTLTGTSVSTLVVSAAAAVQWNQTSAASSFDVMEAVRTRKSFGDNDAAKFVPPVDFCLDAKRNCPPGTFAQRIFVAPPGAPSSLAASAPSTSLQDNLPLRVDLATADRVRLVDLNTFENVPGCEPQILAYEKRPAGGSLCPQRWRFDIAAQPWLGPQPGANHNPDCRYVESSPGTLVLEFVPCFRIEGQAAELDDLTLVAGDVAYRLPVDRFRLGGTARPCPLEDDPRRIQVVLKGISFQGLHPLYLAATVNGKHATITPILQVLKEATERNGK